MPDNHGGNAHRGARYEPAPVPVEIMNKSAERDTARPFVGIIYDCCDTYGRLYLNRTSTAFEGHCPRCYRKVTVAAAENGSEDRFLRG